MAMDAGLGHLRERLEAFAEERDWTRLHTPKNLAMALAGEVGELMSELQWASEEEAASVMTSPAADRVTSEIADVFIYLVRLADVLGVDLLTAASAKMDVNEERFPRSSSLMSPAITTSPARARRMVGSPGRVFQLSTQSQRSIPDARLALDRPRPLAPLRELLTHAGVDVSRWPRGHAWAFSEHTRLGSGSRSVVPGDVALRIDPGLTTSHLYQVLAWAPGQGALAALVNGADWKLGAASYPHLAIFRPVVTFPRRKFLDLVNALRTDTYLTGPRYEARFIPIAAQDLFTELGMEPEQTEG